MFHRFLFCLCLWRLVGAFGIRGEVKYVKVKEGDSVSLISNLTEMMDTDEIQWWFMNENTLIAEIDKRLNSFTVYDDVLDGRFRDRLKLDKQTGSLTITNTRTEHVGIYVLRKTGAKRSLKAFRVSVNVHLPVPVISRGCPSSSTSTSLSLTSSSASSSTSSHPNPISNQTQHLNITQLCHTCSDFVQCCGSTEAVVRLVVTALVGVAAVAAVVVLVYDIRSRRAKQGQAQIHTSGSIEI